MDLARWEPLRMLGLPLIGKRAPLLVGTLLVAASILVAVASAHAESSLVSFSAVAPTTTPVFNPVCNRIVSLAPSVTEELFALGLGQHVVGVTAFCRYPSEAATLPKVGGFLDVSLEAIVAARPTLVVSLVEGVDLSRQAAGIGFSSLEVDHRSVSGIKDSVVKIGEVCGIQNVASLKIQELERIERDIAERVRGASPTKVLVVVGRVADSTAKNTSLYVSGRDAFYSELLAMLGAENVHQATTMAIPTMSPEGLLALNPDVVVEILNLDDLARLVVIEKFWEDYSDISAVKQKRVFVLTDDFASIPSVRYPLLARKLATLIHPERFEREVR